jgi:hypothetical protein
LLFLQEIISERPIIAAENLVCARLTIEKTARKQRNDIDTENTPVLIGKVQSSSVAR